MSDSYALNPVRGRALWLRAQGLDRPAPFGDGPSAASAAVAHLGYVQIDTINVIERCHHHILFSRIPAYDRGDLTRAQSAEKSVFEYWTHALAYIASEDYRFFMPAMRQRRDDASFHAGAVTTPEYKKMLKRIRTDGALSIRDVDDDVLVEKDHPWASRKPSKRLLQTGFYVGDLVISARQGMLKTYELTERHFGWPPRPRPASESQYARYLLTRALRTQTLVSLDSICYGEPKWKRAVRAIIETEVRRKRLVAVHLAGSEKLQHWLAPEALDSDLGGAAAPRVHILSPFDPLVIQRDRLQLFFGYAHRFEAYVPAAKRVFGYFALPVLVGDRIVAAVDLKADRQARKLIIQQWTWIEPQTAELKASVDAALHDFEAFQLPARAEQSQT